MGEPMNPCPDCCLTAWDGEVRTVEIIAWEDDQPIAGICRVHGVVALDGDLERLVPE